jgi:transketolase
MRHDVIRMLEQSKSGHPGGSLSASDILAALWFSGVMTYDQNNPRAPWRDRFIMSKGHAAPGLYAAFKEIGWLNDDDLMTLRQLGSKLQGHPDPHFCEAVEVCSGSLGQGLSVSAGLALGFKKDVAGTDEDPIHVWCLVGDGELQEGSNWEALMFGAHQDLENLTVMVDLNNLQIDGHVTDVNSLGDIDGKLRTFGYHVIRVNGHDMQQVVDALFAARAYKGQPVAIVFETVKGKGVSFMEDQAKWHGTAPNHEQAEQAIAELDAAREAIQEGAAHV